MTFYPPKVQERFRSPKNAGLLRAANAMGTAASFECGAFVRLFLEIDIGSKIIRHAKFQSNGCAYSIAAADEAAARLTGRELTGLHGLADTDIEWIIGEMLAEFPSNRQQCAEMVFNAVTAAFADYRKYLLEEFSGEKTLLCTCFGIATETVEAYIDANSPDSVELVTEVCRAGGGCGSCRMLIQEMIDSHHFETPL